MNVPEESVHYINVKGYYSQVFKDSQTSRNFSDVVYGNGQIIFKGTEEQLDHYLNYLVENEGKFGFKII